MRLLPILLLFFTSQIHAFRQDIHGLREYISEANHCLSDLRTRLNLTKPATRTLLGIVGVGYDDLLARSTLPILAPNFSHCETTPDGQFLVPDGQIAIPIYDTRLDRLASYYRSFEEIEHTIKTTTTLKSNAGFGHFKISSSYSKEYQETKTNMYDYESSILVTKLIYEAYTLSADIVSSPLTPQFQSRVHEIAQALNNSIKVRADYLAQMIVKDYGTHVLLQSKTGAIIQHEVYIDSNTQFASKSSLATVRAAAGLDFLTHVAIGVHAETTKTVTDTDKQNLSSITTHTLLRSKGGPSVERLMGGDPKSTNSFAVDNIVSFENDGLPISELIMAEHFPQFDNGLIMKLRKTLNDAISAYYQHNIIKGCTDRSAANWNFQANVEDGSCKFNNNTYPFGGIFQICEPLPEMPGSSYEQSDDHPSNCADGRISDSCAHLTPSFRCDELTQKNLATGGLTCPQYYAPVRVSSVVNKFPDRVEKIKRKVCKHHLLGKKCHDEYWSATYKDQVRLTTFQCLKNPNYTGPMPVNTGMMFGGLYKIGQVNIFTNSEGCPGMYQKYRLAGDTIVCLSEDYELDAKYAIPFNGFFSCQTPPSLKKCVNGYSQHLATVADSCEIMYCVRPGVFKSLIPPKIKPPPFIDSDVAQSNFSRSTLQVYANDSLILRIPIIDIVNAIVPKTPLTHSNGGKLASNETKVIYTSEQVVASLVHFKGNTFSVLSRIATNVSYFCLKNSK
ncbi:hypothetical protein WR25_09904 isoform B [Diploscapter pachys]|uniref:MACPF domain-containing protein n=1 Tax=Diploscapter pachys TaxID=2018661 RepID=A0A2A2JC29_9BILA|nr:hypothetical protein WR25_09904 isoform B [Diploscapter pachys]